MEPDSGVKWTTAESDVGDIVRTAVYRLSTSYMECLILERIHPYPSIIEVVDSEPERIVKSLQRSDVRVMDVSV